MIALNGRGNKANDDIARLSTIGKSVVDCDNLSRTFH